MLVLSAPGTPRQDPGISLANQHSLIGDPRSLSQNTRWMGPDQKKKKMTSIIDLWPLSVYLCTLLPLRMHVYLHRHKITNKVNAVKNKTPG